MAQTRTITARDPITGATFNRRTARTYHAAVIIDTAAGPKAMAWVGRPDLAPKQLERHSTAGEPARLALVVADPWAEPAAVAEPVAAVRPCLPGEPATAPAPSHGTASPELPDLKGAADKVAALEYLAGGGALSSDVWCALGWPFEAFLAWAQRPDADARESALRARIRRDGVAACLAAL